MLQELIKLLRIKSHFKRVRFKLSPSSSSLSELSYMHRNWVSLEISGGNLSQIFKRIVHSVIQAPILAQVYTNTLRTFCRYWATWNFLFMSAILDLKIAATWNLRLLLSMDIMKPLTWFWYLTVCFFGARSPMVPIATWYSQVFAAVLNLKIAAT